MIFSWNMKIDNVVMEIWRTWIQILETLLTRQLMKLTRLLFFKWCTFLKCYVLFKKKNHVRISLKNISLNTFNLGAGSWKLKYLLVEILPVLTETFHSCFRLKPGWNPCNSCLDLFKTFSDYIDSFWRHFNFALAKRDRFRCV